MPSIPEVTTGANRYQHLHMRSFFWPASIWPALSVALILLALSVCSAAQQSQTGTPPDAPSAQEAPQTTDSFFSVLMTKSFAFPDLATSSAPLSPQQKFNLFVVDSIAPSTFVAAAGGAGINQALNTPAGYGQGAEGYGKRFGSAMARNASAEFFGTWILASTLHEDPRFFVRNDLGFGGSIKYSIRRVFVTRSDSGSQVFNWSGLLGPLAAEGLANVYFPDEYRTVGNTFSRYGYDLGVKAAGNLLLQYWPHINRKLKLTPQPAAPATSSGTAKP